MTASRTFFNPTRVLWSRDGLAGIGEQIRELPLAEPRVGLITGTHAAGACGYTAAVLEGLRPLPSFVFDQVEPEPSHETVVAGTRFVADNRISVLIALGGGSAIDAAKAIACLAHADLDVAAVWNRSVPIAERRIPLIAIPTTAGTGSEVTPFSVLRDARLDVRQSLASPFFYPKVAILVPRLLSSVPRKVIADSGIDALAHAFEALWSIHANPISDALAFRAVELIVSHLVAYQADPENVDHASAMLEAACLAGRAFSNTFTAACHALSYPIGTRLKLTHGHACSMTLHLVAELNGPVIPEKFGRLATLLRLSDPSEIPELIRNLRDRVQPVTRLSQAGATEEDLDGLAAGVYEPLLRNNPVGLSHDDLRNLLARAL